MPERVTTARAHTLVSSAFELSCPPFPPDNLARGADRGARLRQNPSMWGPQTLEGPPADFVGPGGGPLSPFGRRGSAATAAPGSSSSLHQPATASPSSLQGLLALDVNSASPPPPPAAPPPPPLSPPSLGAPFNRGSSSSRAAGIPRSEQGPRFSPSRASPAFIEAFSPTNPHASVLCDQQGGSSEFGAPLWASAEARGTPSFSQSGVPMASFMIATPKPFQATETVCPRSPPMPQWQQPQQQAEQLQLPAQLQQNLEAAAAEHGAKGLLSEQQQQQQPDADLWRDWQQTPHQQDQQEQQPLKQQQQRKQQQDEQEREEQPKQQQEQKEQLKRQPEQQHQVEGKHREQQQQDAQQQEQQQQEQQQADQQQEIYDKLETPSRTLSPSLASLNQQPQSTPPAEATVAQLQQQHHQLEQQLDELWGHRQEAGRTPQQHRQQQEQQEAQPEQQQPQQEQQEVHMQQRRDEEQPQQQEQQQQQRGKEEEQQQQQAREQEVVLSIDEFPSETALGPPRSLPASDASVGAPEAADWGPPVQSGGASPELRGPSNFSWKPLSVDSAHADLTPGEGSPSAAATPPRADGGGPLGPSPCLPSLSPAAAPDSLWHPPHTPIPDTSTAEAAAAAAADAAAGPGSNASQLGVRITAGSAAGEGTPWEGRLQQQTPRDGEGGGPSSQSMGAPLARDLARVGGASRLSGDLASAFSPPKRIREGELDVDAAAAAGAAAEDLAGVPLQSKFERGRSDGLEESAAAAAAGAAAVSRGTTAEGVGGRLGPLRESISRAPTETSRAPQQASAPSAASHFHGGAGGAASRLLRALPFGLGVLRGGTPKQQQGAAAAAPGDTAESSSPQATTEFERLLKEAPGPAVNGAPQPNGRPSQSVLRGVPEAASSSPQGAPPQRGVAGPSGSPRQEGLLPGAPQAARSAKQQPSPGEAVTNGASLKEGSRAVVGGAPAGPVGGGSMGAPQPSMGLGASPHEAHGRPRTPYNLFLERLKHPACAEVVSLLRRFVEGFPAAITRQEAADLLHAFITKAQARLLRTEAFSGGGGPSALEPYGRGGPPGGDPSLGAREAGGAGFGGSPSHLSLGEGEAAEVGEGLERFLIQKLFAVLPKETPEDRQEDAELERKLRCLAWVAPQHLEIPPFLQGVEDGEGFPARGALASEGGGDRGGGGLSGGPSARAAPAEGEGGDEGGAEAGPLSLPEVQLAGLELGRIDRVKAPRDKIRLILSACKLLISVLEKARRTAPAADDLLPLLIYTVIKTRPPRLHTNIQFVAAYRHPARMQGEEAYFFTHFCSAAAFVKSVGSPGIHFHIDPAEYERRVAEAEKALKQEEVNGTSSPAAADRKGHPAAAAAGAAPVAAVGTGSALAAAATALSTLEQLHPSGAVRGPQAGGASGHTYGFRGAALLQHAGAPLLQRQRQLQQQQTRLLLAQLVRTPRTFQTVRTAAHLKVGDLEGLLAEYQELLGVMDRAAVLLQQQLQLDEDCNKLQQQHTTSSDAST
ncbi:hypothetical protein Esti_000207 [Eimeria stiedai]